MLTLRRHRRPTARPPAAEATAAPLAYRFTRSTLAILNLPRLIAFRYLRRPTDALVSAVGLVSVFGLVIGVMALVISMALMTGYRSDLQKKLLGGNAEVFVYSLGGTIADPGRR